MTTLDLPTLAEQYAQAAIDLCRAGAAFSAGSRFLRERQLTKAEEAIREGLDTLARVVAEIPQHDLDEDGGS